MSVLVTQVLFFFFISGEGGREEGLKECGGGEGRRAK